MAIRYFMRFRKNTNKQPEVCPTCGQAEPLPPINSELFTKEFENKWLKKGFRNTLFGLFVRPADSVKAYIHKDRGFLIGPVVYMSMVVGLYTIVYPKLSQHINEFNKEDRETFSQIFPYVQIFQAVLVAYFLKKTNPKVGYSVYEYAVFMVYILAQCLIIHIAFEIIFSLTNWQWLSLISPLVRALYCALAIASFVGNFSILGVLKALAVYLMSFMLFVPIFNLIWFLDKLSLTFFAYLRHW